MNRVESPAATKVPSIEAGNGRRDWLVMLPVAIAAVFLGIRNEEFGFDPAGWLDPFMYLGYFWHYPEHLPGLDHDYKASRLPWILPGYLAHQLGDPAAASVVLAFATLAGGGAAVYLLVRDITRHRTAAAVCAVAWTSCTWVHGIGGWNYHMLAATDYFLLASWLAFRAAETGTGWRALLSGACWAASAHTHIQFATFLPLVWLTWWSALRADAPLWRPIAVDGAWAFAGAIGITAALAAVNAATGGDWLFFMPQLVRAQYLMNQDIWWAEARVWLPIATYLVIPVAFMIGGLFAVIRTSSSGRPWPARVLVLQAWLAFAIMCYTQFARRKGTLDQSFLAFPVYAYGFPCLGVLLARAGDLRRDARVIAGCTAIIIAPLLLLMPATISRVMSDVVSRLGVAALPLLIPPLVLALAGCTVMLAARGAARLYVFAVWFGIVNAWIALAPSAYGINTPGYRRQMLDLFREADGMTAAFDPRLDGIKYWFVDEQVSTPGGALSLAWVFDSYVSTRGWQANLLGHASAVSLEKLTLEDLRTAVCIGILASPQTSAQREADLQAHFTGLGKPLRRVTVRHLKATSLAFDLTLLTAADAPARRGPPCVWR